MQGTVANSTPTRSSVISWPLLTRALRVLHCTLLHCASISIPTLASNTHMYCYVCLPLCNLTLLATPALPNFAFFVFLTYSFFNIPISLPQSPSLWYACSLVLCGLYWVVYTNAPPFCFLLQIVTLSTLGFGINMQSKLHVILYSSEFFYSLRLEGLADSMR